MPRKKNKTRSSSFSEISRLSRWPVFMYVRFVDPLFWTVLNYFTCCWPEKFNGNDLTGYRPRSKCLLLQLKNQIMLTYLVSFHTDCLKSLQYNYAFLSPDRIIKLVKSSVLYDRRHPVGLCYCAVRWNRHYFSEK